MQHYQHPVPYIIFADFESILVPISTVDPSPTHSFTEKVQKHEACGYAYGIVGPDGKSVKPISVYRGENAVDHFLTNIMKEEEELSKILTHVEEIFITTQDELDFKMAKDCYLCKKPLLGDRVKDHDHLTSKYRGALHHRCNLKFRLRKGFRLWEN